MKDIYTVIRQKEADLERIQNEIEALRLSAKLLEETGPAGPIAASATPTPSYPAATPKPQNASRPASAPAAWASAKQFP